MTTDDAEFLARFEAGGIPNADFRHRDHLRMAWLYVRRDGREAGTARIRAGLRHFAAVHGVAHAYHETLTGFWARLMAHVVEVFPDDARFEDANWSSELLDGAPARREWVEPDLRPLP
jgi:hypothetical protein